MVSLRPDKRNIKIMDMKVRGIFIFLKILRKRYSTILTDYTIDVSLRNYKSNDKATNNNNCYVWPIHLFDNWPISFKANEM